MSISVRKAEKHCQELFTLLQTIPGILQKSALELIMVSGEFQHFTSAKQFSSFIGIYPCINESETSIRGYCGMSRIGDKNRRATLYMCSLAAKVELQGYTGGFFRQLPYFPGIGFPNGMACDYPMPNAFSPGYTIQGYTQKPLIGLLA